MKKIIDLERKNNNLEFYGERKIWRDIKNIKNKEELTEEKY